MFLTSKDKILTGYFHQSLNTYPIGVSMLPHGHTIYLGRKGRILLNRKETYSYSGR